MTAWTAMGVWHSVKPLPEGLSLAAPPRAAPGAGFVADYTYLDKAGVRHVEQRIFDRLLGHIGRARHLIVLDMFLFNDFAGATSGDGMRPLSSQVAAALIQRRQEVPELNVVLITDPINHLYGGLEIELFDRMRQAGIEIIKTNLNPLRDSNPAWSGLWRLCCRWLGNSSDGGWLPNPVGEQNITFRSLLALLNFKANHRKTLIADSPTGWVGMVTSGNPHDASSAHSNIAIEFHGAAALDLLETERAVAAFSAPGLGWPGIPDLQPLQRENPDHVTAPVALQVLTEAGIRDAVLDLLGRVGQGDAVELAMFYLSHRDIVRALKRARERGARVRALLDPNKDAFGRTKNGIPNRQVAAEMTRAGVEVRWCHTHGEQCHDKLILARMAGGGAELIAGSANFTRRNLDDLNLETSVRLSGQTGHVVFDDARDYFERRWTNRGNQSFSVDYPVHADTSRLRYWRYRLMEATGLSTF